MKIAKTLDTGQITIIITVLVTVINAVLIFLSCVFLGFPGNIFIVGMCLMVNYMIVKYFLDRFVFRKIKIIYKLIFDSKKDKNQQDSQSDSLDDVNRKVLEWAVSTKKEIANLKSLEEYRKNFVGNISHELKTPIFTIQAYLYTLLDGGLEDKSINIDYLQRAANNVDRLQNIVEDLETISKLEAETAILDIKTFSIKELVLESFDDLESLAAKRKIKLIIKNDTSIDYKVEADRESIRQVITNLLVNSIKYGKEGGATKVSFYDLDNVILIEISDNGLGIEEKHLKHLFDRFYRVDTSRSRKQGGSGLGLSIVKHIIEAHDQTINVRSTPNIGSTFGFTLKKV